ncbi:MULTISPECIES: CoA transferase [unclassified Marinobacter]|jgi:crotonobetainyl-CoA:carnitine CoA-transferase CaiB-like acyl-CoA transferase|uniref:CaiB/BaiF CoA transferase family protein n=1 Tax=unclassified Marinobacter TaxID=83889 RepID=UPI00200CD7D5|nr:MULTISPECIES: CoA transferase [unclassified Marinobacter]UQG55159.1 CoA transferase [Marinobacter sp. M4C]UQG63961.1 CoA transferase [Marinobacter sp. M2C]UQG68244.1 CoA transferase [Marinobacter sp. M1C]
MIDDLLLDGVRVLEFGQIAAGPFAGSLLGDLGADVVKVERPGSGDGMRGWPPLTANDDGELYSENFASLNRNKRSVVFDLKSEDDRPNLMSLCREADVIVENFRPGVMNRLGLGYAQLSAEHPGLIYCSISGYGQTGPYANYGAFDVVVQAMSGLMSVTGEDGSGPVKCGVPVGDFSAGLYSAYAVAAALYKRNRTGRGRHIDCSMLGSMIGVAALQTSEYFGTGQSGQRLGSAHPRNAPYQAFRAKDDYFVIAAGNDKLWRAVCEAVGQPELAEHPDFTDQLRRAKNQQRLTKILEVSFLKNSAAYWLEEMRARGVPASPINDYGDLIADPHVAHMGIVRDLTLPNGVKTRTTGFPLNITDFEFSIRKPPPHLGEHTAEVLRQWGVSKPKNQTS